jgi:transposase
MREIVFTDEVRAKLESLRYTHPDPRTLKRLEILVLRMHGEKQRRIAVLAGCSRSTVARLLNVFAKRGLDDALCFHEQGPTCRLMTHQDSLEAEFTKNPPRTIAQARDRIEQQTGIRRSITQVRKFLRNVLGYWGYWGIAGVKLAPFRYHPKKPCKNMSQLRSNS